MALKENQNKTSLKLPDGVTLLKQTYDKEPTPEGVVVLKLPRFPDDWGGGFGEATRINDGKLSILEGTGTELNLAQVNISNLAPGEIRFWHVHPDTEQRPGQNEVWMINRGTLLVGLIDYREGSKTYGVKQKVVLTAEKAVYIPKGILHGFVNPTNEFVTLIYFTDKQFDSGENTQEMRVNPEQVSYEWVLPEKI